MNDAVVCHIINAMLFNAHQADNPTEAFDDLMTQGTAAHAAGDAVKALTSFESALALNPQDTHAASACAALLFELSRPRAACALLQGIESHLLLDADGCANLGLALLSCNQVQAASAYFEHALKLQPTHQAALTHLGVLAARQQRWLDAIGYAQQCMLSLPNDETSHANLIDYLLGARFIAEALAQILACPAPFKNKPLIAIRNVVALALDAQFDAANLAMTQLSPQAMHQLANFMQRGGAADLPSLFYRQALDAMQDCDWRDYDRLCAVVGENNLHQGYQTNFSATTIDKSKAPPPFTRHHRAIRPADQIHIGIAATSLRDTAATEALANELMLYDSTRFTFHVYAPTPQPQAALSAPLAAHRVVEIAHFTDGEAVWRIRLDRLDIWFDLTLNTPWHRPAIAQHRVAPLQVLPLPAFQQLPGGVYDYVLSDGYLQDESIGKPSHTALARLPHACWTIGHTATASSQTRQAAGLPDDAFVVCVFGHCVHITPTTFASWMQLLRAVPKAVLWLSHCSANAQANLHREAMLAGVQAEKIIFTAMDASARCLLPLADLFLDTPGNCDAPTLVQALRAGVPAITATGSTPASRMGGSILHAAGLPDCVFESYEVMFAEALHLAHNPAALKGLRERIKQSVPQSPLFDLASRAKEMAIAWTMMVERSRAGLAPATFHSADFKLS